MTNITIESSFSHDWVSVKSTDVNVLRTKLEMLKDAAEIAIESDIIWLEDKSNNMIGIANLIGTTSQ